MILKVMPSLYGGIKFHYLLKSETFNRIFEKTLLAYSEASAEKG